MKIKDKSQVPSQKSLFSGSRWQGGCKELETGPSIHRPDRLLLCSRTVVRGTPTLTTTLRRMQTSSKYLYMPFLKLGNEAGRWCMPSLGKQCGFKETGLSDETLPHIREQARNCKASWIPGVVQLAPSLHLACEPSRKSWDPLCWGKIRSKEKQIASKITSHYEETSSSQFWNTLTRPFCNVIQFIKSFYFAN